MAERDSQLIVGRRAIAEYLGVSLQHVTTYIRKRGLPVMRVRRPGGYMATTPSLIDSWIAAQAVEQRQRKKRRA